MNEQDGRTMRAGDIFLYLIGNRKAMLRIAATPWAILVGALLVLSAGIARNYDHLNLLREPEWFIGPFAASLATIVFVSMWVYPGLRLYEIKPSKGYFLTFVSLIWLTAPCAWLYGIPVERFTDIYTATIWNIVFLGVVSLWRVVLIIRAIRVLTGAPLLRATLVILLPASLEMCVGTYFKGLSLVGVMGGVRLPPHDQLLLKVTGFTCVASFWIFVVGVVVFLFTKGKAVESLSRTKAGFPVKAVGMALVCLVLWVPVAIPSYHQIRNRYELKRLFAEERIAEAVAFASSKKREDFPAIHYLAPEPRGYVRSLEHLYMLNADSPQWLRKEWTEGAIEAHKNHYGLNEERITELKQKCPEIFEALIRYQAELEKKGKLSWQEQYWLDRFKQYSKEKDAGRE